MPRVELTGQPIIITGASSGIGEATAIACARAGMPVVIGARREDRLRALAAKIEKAGGKAAWIVMDVTKPEDCRAMVELCVQRFGRVYSVYANAGYGEEMALMQMPDERVRAMFETNFFGSLNIIRPAVAEMLKNPTVPGGYRGHVLWCSSCLARAALPNYAIYCATKASQAMCSSAMRHELREQAIYVSSVHPIGTKTEFGDVVTRLAQGPDGKAVERKTITTPGSLKQSAEFVAEETVRCLLRPKPEVWPGIKSRLVRLGMSVMAAWPALGDFGLRRVKH